MSEAVKIDASEMDAYLARLEADLKRAEDENRGLYILLLDEQRRAASRDGEASARLDELRAQRASIANLPYSTQERDEVSRELDKTIEAAEASANVSKKDGGVAVDVAMEKLNACRERIRTLKGKIAAAKDYLARKTPPAT